MYIRVVMFLLLSLFSINSSAIYKCKNTDGSISYQADICKNQEELKISTINKPHEVRFEEVRLSIPRRGNNYVISAKIPSHWKNIFEMSKTEVNSYGLSGSVPNKAPNNQFYFFSERSNMKVRILIQPDIFLIKNKDKADLKNKRYYAKHLINKFVSKAESTYRYQHRRKFSKKNGIKKKDINIIKGQGESAETYYESKYSQYYWSKTIIIFDNGLHIHVNLIINKNSEQDYNNVMNLIKYGINRAPLE